MNLKAFVMSRPTIWLTGSLVAVVALVFVCRSFLKPKVDSVSSIVVNGFGGKKTVFDLKKCPSIAEIDPYPKEHKPVMGHVFLAEVVGHNGSSVNGLIMIPDDGRGYSFWPSRSLWQQFTEPDDLCSRAIVSVDEAILWSNFVYEAKAAYAASKQ